MPEEKHAHVSDAELLAKAIPIQTVQPEAVELEPIDEVPSSGIRTPGIGTPGIGTPGADATPEAIELAEGDESTPKEIRTFGSKKRHEDIWKRTPNATGQGAIHVRSFVAKLRLDAIENLDQQINQWLDTHPEYEVKFVTITMGELTGKIKEPALFMSVWV